MTKVPSKTPQQMLEFWERELDQLDRQETLEGITLWSRNFIVAKIAIYDEELKALEVSLIQKELREKKD